MPKANFLYALEFASGSHIKFQHSKLLGISRVLQ